MFLYLCLQQNQILKVQLLWSSNYMLMFWGGLVLVDFPLRFFCFVPKGVNAYSHVPVRHRLAPVPTRDKHSNLC